MQTDQRYAIQFGLLFYAGQVDRLWTFEAAGAARLTLGKASAIALEGEKVVPHPEGDYPKMVVRCEYDGVMYAVPYPCDSLKDAVACVAAYKFMRDNLQVFVEVVSGGYLNRDGFSVFKELW